VYGRHLESDFVLQNHRLWQDIWTLIIREKLAVLWEVSNLPESFQDKAELYIDRVNQKLVHNKRFWVEANSYFAYKVIIDIAVKCFPLDNRIVSHEDTLKPENNELAFILFQIPTLSFAYSASTQRKQRKFMGIRKGLFG
jgi:hypothetical protein